MAQAMHVEKHSHLTHFCYFALAAAAILMICSLNSPMYAMNTQCDVNCFITVARGVLKGRMPYRDLMDHKGPLTYLLHALVLGAFPWKFLGIWIMEWICVSVSLFYMHRIMRMYLPSVNIGWCALVMAMICSSRMFKQGDMVEEICWPFMLCTLHAGLRSIHEDKPLSLPVLVLHGLLAGCVSAIKINLLGVHFAFMAILAIRMATRGRSFSRAIQMCACYLLGMALAWLPILVWLGINGAINDLWRVYFIANATNYQVTRYSVPVRIVRNFARQLLQNNRLMIMALAGNLALLIAPRRWIDPWEKALWILAEAMVVAFTYMGGQWPDYYILSYAPFGMLMLLCLRPFEKRLALKRRASIALACCFLIACMGTAWGFCQEKVNMFIPLEEFPQTAVAKRMHQSENPTMLTYGVLDYGFYYAADILPNSPYFCLLFANREEGKEAQESYLRDGKQEYVVTYHQELSELSAYADQYHLVLTCSPDQFKDKSFSGNYYLYQRKDALSAAEAAQADASSP